MNVPNLSLSVAEALLRTQHPKGKQLGAGEAERAHAVIAVSREVGALGETVARELGRRLGCPVYSREIVEKIAEELRQPASQLQRMDERPTFWIEDWVNGFTGHHNVIAWVKADGRNDEWMPDAGPDGWKDNQSPDAVTAETEAAEYKAWRQKLNAAGLAIGATEKK